MRWAAPFVDYPVQSRPEFLQRFRIGIPGEAADLTCNYHRVLTFPNLPKPPHSFLFLFYRLRTLNLKQGLRQDKMFSLLLVCYSFSLYSLLRNKRLMFYRCCFFMFVFHKCRWFLYINGRACRERRSALLRILLHSSLKASCRFSAWREKLSNETLAKLPTALYLDYYQKTQVSFRKTISQIGIHFPWKFWSAVASTD